MFEYKVAVGFTSVRPVRPDQHVHVVTIFADSDHDAHLFALHFVGSNPRCVMPTSSEILEVEL